MEQPSIRIHQQKRRSMVMKLTPVGVVVFIPEWLTPDSPQVRKFIREGLAKLKPPALPDAADALSQEAIRSLVNTWAATMGVKPGRIQFREMYRKWGSCSRRGNITFNTALCTLPPALAEYIVVHELAHLLVFNHGKDFKALMSQHMPDWKARETQLDRILSGGMQDT